MHGPQHRVSYLGLALVSSLPQPPHRGPPGFGCDAIEGVLMDTVATVARSKVLISLCFLTQREMLTPRDVWQRTGAWPVPRLIVGDDIDRCDNHRDGAGAIEVTMGLCCGADRIMPSARSRLFEGYGLRYVDCHGGPAGQDCLARVPDGPTRHPELAHRHRRSS